MMKNSQGFSFLEVFVVLCLTSAVSLYLLQQQSRLAECSARLKLKQETFMVKTNLRERGLSQGFSLVEFIISLCLISLLLLSLGQHYLNFKKQSKSLQVATIKALDLNLVSDLIRHASQRAGFTPCLGLSQLLSVDRRKESKSLQSIDISKADEVRYFGMEGNFSLVLKQLSANELLLDKGAILDKKYPVMIADCIHAEVQELSEERSFAHSHLVRLKKPLAFKYLPPFYLGSWSEERFFIAKNHQGLKALYYESKGRAELSSFIHQLSAKIFSDTKKPLLAVRLEINSGEPLTLETQLRNL